VSAHVKLQDDPQYGFWHNAFSGLEYYYGHDAGPVARRAVRYHRSPRHARATALDAGCGEGQDLVFLAEQGYRATGIDFTPSGIRKAAGLLADRGHEVELLEMDLRHIPSPDGPLGPRRFDLVVAVNSIQFMGEDAHPTLLALRERVAPGGVIGLSLFGRDENQAALQNSCWMTTLTEVMEVFDGWQMLEAAQLWQWTPHPQPFVTLIARKPDR